VPPILAPEYDVLHEPLLWCAMIFLLFRYVELTDLRRFLFVESSVFKHNSSYAGKRYISTLLLPLGTVDEYVPLPHVAVAQEQALLRILSASYLPTGMVTT